MLKSFVGAEQDWGFQNLGLLQNGVIEIPASITLTTAMQHITKVSRGTAVNVENVTAAYRNHSACTTVFREAGASLRTEIRKLRFVLVQSRRVSLRGETGPFTESHPQ